MDDQDKNWPAWRYGPNGQSGVFETAKDAPSGWEDHPSKVKGSVPAGGGTQTATASANGSVSAERAAKTRTAPSQNAIDPAKAANSGVRADGSTAQTASTEKPADKPADQPELDAHGHPWSEEIHADTKTLTKAGLWRLKSGAARPEPAEGYPLDL